LTKEPKETKVLVVGDRKESVSLLVCLLKAGHEAILITTNKELAIKRANQHISDLSNYYKLSYHLNLDIRDTLDRIDNLSLAIIVTDEDVNLKKETITKLQAAYNKHVQILVNAESIALSELQSGSEYPQNII